VGWVGGADGLLVLDRNANGRIDDGRELFGAITPLPDGSRAGHGFNALAALDSNHDGVVNAADGQFRQLQVWIDGNHDGVTDAGELKGLVELGITGLNLAHVASDRVDHGNGIGLVGSYTTADGSEREMADVWFTREPTTSDTPALDDLLVAAPVAPVAPVDSGEAGSGHAAPPDIGMPRLRTPVDEVELQRHAQLLI
jgi:hypothetical protein